jgi:metal-responsive CopG/Arc/MetJ family transcriptional regulator
MPRKPSGFTQFNIRMPRDLLDALDQEVEERRRGQAEGEGTYTRSDLIREVLHAHVARKTKRKKAAR